MRRTSLPAASVQNRLTASARSSPDPHDARGRNQKNQCRQRQPSSVDHPGDGQLPKFNLENVSGRQPVSRRLKNQLREIAVATDVRAWEIAGDFFRFRRADAHAYVGAWQIQRTMPHAMVLRVAQHVSEFQFSLAGCPGDHQRVGLRNRIVDRQPIAPQHHASDVIREIDLLQVVVVLDDQPLDVELLLIRGGGGRFRIGSGLFLGRFRFGISGRFGSRLVLSRRDRFGCLRLLSVANWLSPQGGAWESEPLFSLGIALKTVRP